MEVGLDHGVQRPLSCVCACQSIDLMLPGSLLSWFPSVLLTPVLVYWSFCDLGLSRPVWGCLETLQAQVPEPASKRLVKRRTAFPAPALRNLCPQFPHPLGWEHFLDPAPKPQSFRP